MTVNVNYVIIVKGVYFMNNREKEIIDAVKSDIKNFQENCNKSEIVRFLDYTIILGKELNFSDEFMERLYFLRYYYNIGGNYNEKS